MAASAANLQQNLACKLGDLPCPARRAALLTRAVVRQQLRGPSCGTLGNMIIPCEGGNFRVGVIIQSCRSRQRPSLYFPLPAGISRRRSALLAPCQGVCAIPQELTLDLLALDAPIEFLSVSGRHRQRPVGSRTSFERSVIPPDPREAVADHQFRQGTEGGARSGSRVTLGAGP